jgi:hypothetical protein
VEEGQDGLGKESSGIERLGGGSKLDGARDGERRRSTGGPEGDGQVDNRG